MFFGKLIQFEMSHRYAVCVEDLDILWNADGAVGKRLFMPLVNVSAGAITKRLNKNPAIRQ